MAAAPQRQRTAGGVHWMDAEMDLEEATLMIQSKFKTMQAVKKLRALKGLLGHGSDRKANGKPVKKPAGKSRPKGDPGAWDRPGTPEGEAAATKLQSAFRGHAAHQRLHDDAEMRAEQEEETKAAVLIQRNARGRAARKRVQFLKENGEEPPSPVKSQAREPALFDVLHTPAREAAAVTVQRHVRGHKARTPGPDVAPPTPKTMTLPPTPWDDEDAAEERAATRIQSLQRGRVARREVAKRRATQGKSAAFRTVEA